MVNSIAYQGNMFYPMPVKFTIPEGKGWYQKYGDYYRGQLALKNYEVTCYGVTKKDYLFTGLVDGFLCDEQHLGFVEKSIVINIKWGGKALSYLLYCLFRKVVG